VAGHGRGRRAGEIRLWRVSGLSLRSTPSDRASKEPGPQPEHTLKGDESFVTGVAFSPDGTRLASNWEGVIRFWEVESGRELPGFECEGAVAPGTFSPDGKLLAAADEDGTVACGRWKRDRSNFPERPGGCFAEIGPVPFSSGETGAGPTWT